MPNQKLPDSSPAEIACPGNAVENSGNPVQTGVFDYTPFGMQMPDRSYIATNSGYRFGFNQKELDPEGMGGGGSTYDYGFRIYNPQIARFLSVDPLFKSFPFYTPYQFSGNKPIAFKDIDGLEDIYYLYTLGEENGEVILELLTSTEIGAMIIDAFKNSDPEIGPVNKGYDVYIRPVTLQEMQEHQMFGGIVEFGHKDETMFIPGEGVKEYPLLEAIIKSRENKNSAGYKYFVRSFGEDFVNDPNLQSTLDNNRGFIVIAITPGAKSASTNRNAAAGAASTLGHELLCHGNEISQTEKMPNATRIIQQHLEHTGNPRGAPAKEGSTQYKLEMQIRKKISE